VTSTEPVLTNGRAQSPVLHQYFVAHWVLQKIVPKGMFVEIANWLFIRKIECNRWLSGSEAKGDCHKKRADTICPLNLVGANFHSPHYQNYLEVTSVFTFSKFNFPSFKSNRILEPGTTVPPRIDFES